MPTKEDIFNRREEIIAVAKHYGASDLRIFGSVARDEATSSSDVDFLVRLVALSGQAVPVFWLGLILIITVSLRWKLLPTGG